MKRTFYFGLLILFGLISCNNKIAQTHEIIKKASTIKNVDEDKLYILKNVYLIPMTSDTIIKSQTVLVKNGIIEDIFKTGSKEISKSYQIIDGSGKYLMPGLADMHTHIRENRDLSFFIYNGITTVLNMGGPSNILEMRAEVKNNNLIGPQIFASAYVDGVQPTYWLVDNPEAARAVVQEVKLKGWDFIKAYSSLSNDSFYALLEEASKQDISVVGHGIRDVGIEESLIAGQKMIAHAEEYLYAHFGNHLNINLIPEIVKVTHEARAFLTANLSTYSRINEQWGSRFAVFLEKTLTRPEIQYLSNATIESWKNSNKYTNRKGNLDERLEFLETLTFEMYKAGVPLLLGTDSPAPDIVGMFPGFSIHEDLAAYKKVGLSNYEVLKTGTLNAGLFIKENVSNDILFGIIKKGYRADIILLKNNPLINIDNIKKIEGVMLNGNWLNRKYLDSLIKR